MAAKQWKGYLLLSLLFFAQSVLARDAAQRASTSTFLDLGMSSSAADPSIADCHKRMMADTQKTDAFLKNNELDTSQPFVFVWSAGYNWIYTVYAFVGKRRGLFVIYYFREDDTSSARRVSRRTANRIMSSLGHLESAHLGADDNSTDQGCDLVVQRADDIHAFLGQSGRKVAYRGRFLVDDFFSAIEPYLP